jgi:hypothetical protein
MALPITPPTTVLKIELLLGGPIEIRKGLNEFLSKIDGGKVVDIKVTEAMSCICVLVIYES